MMIVSKVVIVNWFPPRPCLQTALTVMALPQSDNGYYYRPEAFFKAAIL